MIFVIIIIFFIEIYYTELLYFKKRNSHALVNLSAAICKRSKRLIMSFVYIWSNRFASFYLSEIIVNSKLAVVVIPSYFKEVSSRWSRQILSLRARNEVLYAIITSFRDKGRSIFGTRVTQSWLADNIESWHTRYTMSYESITSCHTLVNVALQNSRRPPSTCVDI